MPEASTETRADGDTRHLILDVAEELLLTRGYVAFSYQDIAARIGIRKASIHYHFPSKADLGLAIIERGVARTQHVRTRDLSDPAARLEDYFRHFEQLNRDGCRI